MNFDNLPEFLIRPIDINDQPGLQKLADKLLGENIHLSSINSKIAKLIDDPRQIYLGAFVGQEVIGFISAEKDPLLSKDCSWLELFIDPTWRSRGVGSLLLKSLISECDKHEKIKCLLLSVEKKNKPAIKLYFKYGFVKKHNLKSLFSSIVNMHVYTISNKLM